MPVQCTCIVCGAAFLVDPYRAPKARYCSNPCRHIGHSEELRKPPSIPFTCEACGNSSLITKRQQTGSIKRFCNSSCHALAMHRDPVAQYERKVIRQDGCWEWAGKTDRRGYGYFDLSRSGKRVTYRAHRLAFETASGVRIPRGFEVCHSCDNPRCTNNDEAGIYVINGVARPRFGHLWLGTRADNHADMMVKQRNFSGPRH